MKCSKCGSLPKESDQFAWRCNSCKKVYRVSLKNIQGFAEKKKGGITEPLLKCKECGASLDDGHETIAWKCSCGNVTARNLIYFMSEEKDELAVVENALDYINPRLIRCPDCGREVSKRAAVCPGCGCPLSEMITSGVVKIKLPNTQSISGGWIGLLSSKSAEIRSNGKVIWSGKHGETASFIVEASTDIEIDLGSWANWVTGTVEPKKKYELIQDFGFHMLATYRLSEVDVIDSDR